MPRPAVVVALPPGESVYVCAELVEAGFDVVEVMDAPDLKRALDSRRDIGLAVLDGEIDGDDALAFETVIRAATHPVASLTVVSPRALERFEALNTGNDDEFFTRPYSADSIRWRVEAMCIRRETVDDGSGPVLRGGDAGMGGWNKRGTTVSVFNPKGGVGKTTVATNLASALQTRKGKSVLLIDADTVTGHVTMSLGIDAVRTVADAWRDEAEGGPAEDLLSIASSHPSGMKVVALTDSPLNTDVLDPARLAAAIVDARPWVDVIVLDVHPSSSTINQAIFDESDRILVPVTPDVPAIRAAV
ncbi:MAG TPA: AAA family ATPase, partial [Candidatus Limnocylindrales bacterium]